MNEIAYLTIPSEQVHGVTRTTLSLFGAHAEAVGATALAFVDGGEELAELQHARDELTAIEDVLVDLGWPRPHDGRDAEVSGPAGLLREILRAALLDAADRVVQAVRRYEAADEELPAVRRAVDAVGALFAAFEAMEGPQMR
jgi:hypothetical protein